MNSGHAGPSTGWHAFPTPLGTCGIAWHGSTITATSLPGTQFDGPARDRGRRVEAAPSTPPHSVRRVLEAITDLLGGASVDLTAIDCDLGEPGSFEARVYDEARAIPPGRTTTYGEIAARLGDASLARAVGRALGRNPLPIIVPCHRVMGADGRLTGFSAPGGVETKLRMLAIEGAEPGSGPGLFGALPLVMRPRR